MTSFRLRRLGGTHREAEELFWLTHGFWQIGQCYTARPANILAIVFRQVLQLVLSGLLCGFLAAWILGKLYGSRLYMVPYQHDSVLYGVGIHDPLSLSCAAAAVLAAAVVAALLPALRAAGIAPHVALRCD